MNKWIGTGRLGRDVELKYTQTGKAVASFSIAVSEKWSSNGEKQERTDWINIVAWDKLGELCSKYIFKGSKVLIEGKIQTRSYDDKNGVKKYVTEIVAQQVEFLDSKKQDSSGGSYEDAGAPSGGGGGSLDDDIPFAP